jgi:hypothetical protein
MERPETRHADGVEEPEMILFIILAALAFVLFFMAGYAIGQRSANKAIRHERELVVNLQAQNDGLQSRMLTMLDETIKGGQK